MEKTVVFNLCFPKETLSLPSLSNITNHISGLVKRPTFLENKLNEVAEAVFSEGIRQNASCKVMTKSEYHLEDNFKLAFLSSNSY